jgi:hypothetical protein
MGDNPYNNVLSAYTGYAILIMFMSCMCATLTLLFYEPRHDKTNTMGLRPGWIQTSLRIRAVWSGSMQFAFKLYYK